jgi:hypothetical protein
MEQIHSHFRITVEREAWWHFWRGVAEQMPLGGLPATAAELQEWMLDYEDRNWGYSEGGRKVVDTFFEDWPERLTASRSRGRHRRGRARRR